MQKLLSREQLDLTVQRLAYQLIENDGEANDVVYIGLQPRGIYISDAITSVVKSISKKDINYGKLDITFYRDDFKNEFHSANQTDISFSVENKKVVLIDDVLYTGRTIRAALDALLDFGTDGKDLDRVAMSTTDFLGSFVFDIHLGAPPISGGGILVDGP